MLLCSTVEDLSRPHTFADSSLWGCGRQEASELGAGEVSVAVASAPVWAATQLSLLAGTLWAAATWLCHMPTGAAMCGGRTLHAGTGDTVRVQWHYDKMASM